MKKVAFNIFFFFFFFIKNEFICPEAAQIPLKNLMHINTKFLSEYLNYKKTNKHAVNLQNYCNDFHDRLTRHISNLSSEVSFLERQSTSESLAINKNRLKKDISLFEEFVIKICMNSEEYSEELKEMFLSGKKADFNVDQFQPIITDFILATIALIVKVSINNQKVVFKLPLSYLQNGGSSSGSSGKLKLINNKTILQSSIELKNEVRIMNKFDEYNISKGYFVDYCSNEKYGYPNNFVVMKDGGNTLFDYMNKLFKNQIEPLASEERSHLYLRLVHLFKKFKELNISICDLKPDNILFDPNNIIDTELIDFGAVKFENKRCDIHSIHYAPPEINKSHFLLLVIELNRKEFTNGENWEFKYNIITLLINRLTSELNRRWTFKDYFNTGKYQRSNKVRQLLKLATDVKEMIDRKEEFNIKEYNNILNELWSQTMKEKERYIRLYTEPEPKLPNNSHNFDIFTIGVTIFEFELLNCFKSLNKVKPEKINDSQELFLLFSKIRKEFNLGYYTSPVLKKIGFPPNHYHMDWHKAKLSKLIAYFQHAPGCNKHLLEYINNFILIEESLRMPLEGLEEAIKLSFLSQII